MSDGFNYEGMIEAGRKANIDLVPEECEQSVAASLEQNHLLVNRGCRHASVCDSLVRAGGSDG